LSKLKDCPLCGGRSQMITWVDQHVTFMQNGNIMCTKCRLVMPIWQDIRTEERYETAQEEAAIKKWNTRLGDQNEN